MTRYLDAEEILLIQYMLVSKFGGSHGVRDLSRVQSVSVAAAQTVHGMPQYPSIFEKAAVYARNIISDHPFKDGNKRTGIAAAAMFLQLNGYLLHADSEELEDFAVAVAVNKLTVAEIAGWLERNADRS